MMRVLLFGMLLPVGRGCAQWEALRQSAWEFDWARGENLSEARQLLSHLLAMLQAGRGGEILVNPYTGAPFQRGRTPEQHALRATIDIAVTRFEKLNDGWNAEPGAPCPVVGIQDQTLVLTFYLNPWIFPDTKLGDVGELRFASCWRYRLGGTNEDGWWLRQCRFSLLAPGWGEFYEVRGDLRLDRLPDHAWTLTGTLPAEATSRHFLFYFKDETFECDAEGWRFRVIPAADGALDGAREISLSSGHSVLLTPPRSSPTATGIRVIRPNWFGWLLSAFVRRCLSKHRSS